MLSRRYLESWCNNVSSGNDETKLNKLLLVVPLIIIEWLFSWLTCLVRLAFTLSLIMNISDTRVILITIPIVDNLARSLWVRKLCRANRMASLICLASYCESAA